jgi:hypothetical protein
LKTKQLPTFPNLGGKWYVFVDKRNRLGAYETLAEAQAAAAEHFRKGRKKNL